MLKLIAYLIEVAGWIRIAAAPFLIALGIGAYIYTSDPGRFTLAYAIGVVLLGLTVGVLWATRVWKKTGTTEFLSRVDATPELNKPQENPDNK
jgi:hypothetical protein